MLPFLLQQGETQHFITWAFSDIDDEAEGATTHCFSREETGLAMENASQVKIFCEWIHDTSCDNNYEDESVLFGEPI